MVDVEGEVDQLRKAIEGLHRCSARLAQSVPVKETDKGTAVWDGVVHVFDLTGHPAATRIYAWSSPIAENRRSAAYCITVGLRRRRMPCGRR
jgi:hypothetical protein